MTVVVATRRLRASDSSRSKDLFIILERVQRDRAFWGWHQSFEYLTFSTAHFNAPDEANLI